MKKLFIHFIAPSLAILMLLFTFFSISEDRDVKIKEPYIPPAVSNFKNKVSGLGVVEPDTNLINVGTHIPGVLTKLYIVEGQKIKKNDPLFTINETTARANLAQAQTQLDLAQVNHNDAKSNLDFFENLKDKRGISYQDLTTRRFALQRAKAQLNGAQANYATSQENLNLLTVRSSIDGCILKINTREGEYVASPSNPSNAPLIIGNLDKLYVRVRVDEMDIHRIDQDAKAVGMLRGRSDMHIQLQFVKYEPYVLPKTNLTNNASASSMEKIDTRVLEIIYEFDNSLANAIPGQQMDVFIDTQR